MKRIFEQFNGSKLNHLTILNSWFDGKKTVSQCLCDCGNKKIIPFNKVKNSLIKSCGCSTDRHGMSESSEYGSWATMKARCLNPNNPTFVHYGAKGIGVCAKWITSFSLFLKDMGKKPGPKYSLDRIDNSKGYFPGNVRWATRTQQMNNTGRNRLIAYNGKTQNVTQWANEKGLSVKTLRNRLFAYKWSLEKSLNYPLRAHVTVA